MNLCVIGIVIIQSFLTYNTDQHLSSPQNVNCVNVNTWPTALTLPSEDV